MRFISVGAALVIMTLGITGCSEDDLPDDVVEHTMDEPNATPADEVDGDRLTGEFEVLDTAPPGSENVEGEAFVTQNDDGTTVTVHLEQLVADEEYEAHLHAQPCAEDDGGPHFAFDPDGEEVPPNEVHLGFISDSDGTGEATVTNDRRVEDAAPSVVVHPAEDTSERLACADLAPE